MWVIFLFAHFPQTVGEGLICLIKISFVYLRYHIHNDVDMGHIGDEAFELRYWIDCDLKHLLHLSIHLSFITNKDYVRYAKDVEDNSVVETGIFFLRGLDAFGIENENFFEPWYLILLIYINETSVDTFGTTSSRWLKLCSKQSIKKQRFSRRLRPNDWNN